MGELGVLWWGRGWKVQDKACTTPWPGTASHHPSRKSFHTGRRRVPQVLKQTLKVWDGMLEVVGWVNVHV